MSRHSGGFSLVELMVAISLALLVTGAVISVFVGSRSAYQATAGVAELADSGRFAVDLIQESVRGAGFLECNHATAQTSQSILNSVASTLAYDFPHGIAGFEAAGTGAGGAVVLPATPAADGSTADWAPALDAALVPATNQQIQGSDVLVLRSSVPRFTPTYTTADVSVGANSFAVADAGSLQPGQLATISDCTKSVTFQISNVVAGTPGSVGFGGAIGPPGNASISMPLPFQAGALVSPVMTVVYYIGVGADGDGALKRLELSNGTVNGAQIFTDEELVPGVENMQVLYGIDSTGAQAASAYVTADQIADFDSVVSIKVAVLSASAAGGAQPPVAAPTFNLLGTTVTAPQDTRARKVFDVTITLRNAVN